MDSDDGAAKRSFEKVSKISALLQNNLPGAWEPAIAQATTA
jgi:hypothetical protein